MYTELYSQRMPNKVLGSSTGNSAHCYAAAWQGGEFRGECMHVCEWLRLSAGHLNLPQQCSSAASQQKIKVPWSSWAVTFLQRCCHDTTYSWNSFSEKPNWACDTQFSVGVTLHFKGRLDFWKQPKVTFWTSLVAQMVKRLPAVCEIWVPFLGQEDPLEKEMATHSSALAWKIPWMEEPSGLQSMGSQRDGHEWATSLSLKSFRLSVMTKLGD